MMGLELLTGDHPMSAMDRMMQTKEGQVAPCRPGCGACCSQCVSGRKSSKKKGVQLGRCAQVEAMHRRPGRPYDGEKAIACAKFEAAS
ncbi:MAG: hypothetical protein ACJA1L_000347 [Paracoccaceae bacterium]|jgi:hypothetical protein